MERLLHLGAREKTLFHGTPDEDTVRCICNQNFDPRMHGRHGTVYGKGVYFSTTAKYSNQYTNPCPRNRGRSFMFFGRVLVGECTLGKPEMQRPPAVDPTRPHGALFDSCVNNTMSPTIFVIFDNDQCYPEFLVEYESFERDVTFDAVSGGVTHRVGAAVTTQRGAAAAAIFAPANPSSSATSRTGTGTQRPPAVAAPIYTGQYVSPGQTRTPVPASPTAAATQPTLKSSTTQEPKKPCLVM